MDGNLNVTEPSNGQPNRSNFFDYLYILFKHRKIILGVILLTGIITAGITLLMPNWYAATASVLPPKRPGGLMSMLEGGFSSLLRNLPGMGVKFGSSQEAYSYLAILNSRNAMERVAQKFDLIKVYETRKNSLESTIKELRENCEFDFATEGNINVTVYDKDPQRAADMANYFVEILNEMSVQLGTQEARNNREFIERRYQKNLEDLRAAEDSMKAFQQRYGIYTLTEQTQSAIKGAAELKAEQAAKEIELSIARTALGANNPKTEELQLQLGAINSKLREIKYGTPDWYSDKSLNLFVPFKDVPELGLDYVRLYRELQVQNRMVEFLLPLYEQAKIDEQKDMAVVLSLDHAVPPERKKKPPRTLIVLVFTTLATMASVTWAFAREIYEREKEHNPKVATLTEEIKKGALYQKVFRRGKAPFERI